MMWFIDHRRANTRFLAGWPMFTNPCRPGTVGVKAVEETIDMYTQTAEPPQRNLHLDVSSRTSLERGLGTTRGSHEVSVSRLSLLRKWRQLTWCSCPWRSSRSSSEGSWQTNWAPPRGRSSWWWTEPWPGSRRRRRVWGRWSTGRGGSWSCRRSLCSG